MKIKISGTKPNTPDFDTRANMYDSYLCQRDKILLSDKQMIHMSDSYLTRDMKHIGIELKKQP